MTTPPIPAEVEALARQYCVEAGLDPDETNTSGHESYKTWETVRCTAHDFILMTRAYEKLRAGE